MYCNYCGCDCVVVHQIENACSECELRNPSPPVIDFADLLDEARDVIEEKMCIEGRSE